MRSPRVTARKTQAHITIETTGRQSARRQRVGTYAVTLATPIRRTAALCVVLALSSLSLSVVAASPAQAYGWCGLCLPDPERLVWDWVDTADRISSDRVWDESRTVNEGRAGTTTALTFGVSRSWWTPSYDYEEVHVWTEGLTANRLPSFDDYIDINEKVWLSPSASGKTMTVTVNGDNVEEPDEDFLLHIGRYTIKVTIRSDDLPASAGLTYGSGYYGYPIYDGPRVEADPWVDAFSIADAEVAEGDAGSTTEAALTVSRSSDFSPNHDVMVRVTTADGTAQQSTDYVHLDKQVTFRPWETSKQVTVTVNGDDAHEDDETFSVLLYNDNGSAGPPAGSPGRVTIRDDDNVSGVGGPAAAVRPVLAPEGAPPSAGGPALSVSDAPDVAEGTPEMGHTQGFARFTVSLSAPASTEVSVDYKTAGGNASGADGDYKIADDTLVIPEGETSGVVEVPVTMDSSIEPDEEFFLHLSRPSGAVLADSLGRATIYDDDPNSTATLSVDDPKVVEGNAGTTTQAVFTVKVSKPVAAPFTTRAVTADGTAHRHPGPSNDYVHLDQVITFARDETIKQVAVTINGDNVDEHDETFSVALKDSSGPLRDKRQGVGIIANDDGSPSMSIDDVTVSEGNAGTTEASFTISLAHPSYRPISVNYATANGTARSTNHGTFGPADYAPVSGIANFAPGQTNHTVVVRVNGDILEEQDEQFVVRLSGNVNATAVKRVGTGTIRNDD